MCVCKWRQKGLSHLTGTHSRLSNRGDVYNLLTVLRGGKNVLPPRYIFLGLKIVSNAVSCFDGSQQWESGIFRGIERHDILYLPAAAIWRFQGDCIMKNKQKVGRLWGLSAVRESPVIDGVGAHLEQVAPTIVVWEIRFGCWVKGITFSFSVYFLSEVWTVRFDNIFWDLCEVAVPLNTSCITFPSSDDIVVVFGHGSPFWQICPVQY